MFIKSNQIGPAQIYRLKSIVKLSKIFEVLDGVIIKKGMITYTRVSRCAATIAHIVNEVTNREKSVRAKMYVLKENLFVG